MNKENGKAIELCEIGDVSVVAFDVANGLTKVSKYVGITLMDKNGIPAISESGGYIKAKREDILKSKDDELVVLNRFSIAFTPDQRRSAMTKLRCALRKNNKVIEDHGERSVRDLYCEFYREALNNVNECEADGVEKVMQKKDGVWVKDSVMDEILTKIGCDMTKTVFCKRLVEFGELMGEEMIEQNRDEGYSSNTTVKDKEGKSIQKRYYRLKRVEKLFQK